MRSKSICLCPLQRLYFTLVVITVEYRLESVKVAWSEHPVLSIISFLQLGQNGQLKGNASILICQIVSHLVHWYHCHIVLWRSQRSSVFSCRSIHRFLCCTTALQYVPFHCTRKTDWCTVLSSCYTHISLTIGGVRPSVTAG